MLVAENILAIAVVMLLATLFLWPQIHYSRQTVLYQGALVGFGAYAGVFMVTKTGSGWLVATIAASLIAGAAGSFFARLSANVESDRLSTLTLGLQLVLFNVFLLADPITGGPTGIFFVPPMFGSIGVEVGVFGFLALLASAVLILLPSSALGRHCRALGDDALLYRTMGGNVDLMKMILGGAAGAGAGAAGCLLVSHLSVAEPSLFSLPLSIALVAMAMFVPARPVFAVIAGAVIFSATPEVLRFAGLDAASAAYGQQALFNLLLIVAAFRAVRAEVAAPGALTGGALM